MGLRVGGFQAKSFFKLVLRFIKPALLGEHHTIIEMRPRVVGIQPHRLAKFNSCAVELAGRIQFPTEFKMRLPIQWIEPD